MPQLKVQVNTDAKPAGQIYEGDTHPPKGTYTGFIQRATLKQAGTGNVYFNLLIILDNNQGKKAEYDGLPAWHMVHMTESENIQAELGMFMEAVTGKNIREQNINHESDADLTSPKGSTVRSIGGVKPIGKSVKFEIEYQTDPGYGEQMRLRNVRPFDPTALPKPMGVDDSAVEIEVESEEEEAEVDETEEGEEMTREEREAELKKESLADLKAAALAAEIDIKGLKKADLIEAILDWEYEDADEEDEEADDEEAEEDEESTEEEEDDEEEDEEEGDEEEAEEDEADPVADLQAELADLDRTAIKARLKDADPEYKVLKKHTDDDLRKAVVDALFPTPF